MYIFGVTAFFVTASLPSVQAGLLAQRRPEELVLAGPVSGVPRGVSPLCPLRPAWELSGGGAAPGLGVARKRGPPSPGAERPRWASRVLGPQPEFKLFTWRRLLPEVLGAGEIVHPVFPPCSVLLKVAAAQQRGFPEASSVHARKCPGVSATEGLLHGCVPPCGSLRAPVAAGGSPRSPASPQVARAGLVARSLLLERRGPHPAHVVAVSCLPVLLLS